MFTVTAVLVVWYCALHLATNDVYTFSGNGPIIPV